MDTRDSQALRIVRDALELEPPARVRHVDQHCGTDAALRARAHVLLERAQALDREQEQAAPCADDALMADRLVGSRLGPFRVVARIGRGGMGVVYRGEREDADFRQTVALKLIRRGFDFDDVHARFLRERRILSRLSHPNLARFIDGGVTEDRRPWFALEYVEGEAITRWCDRRRLDVRARVRLLLDVCAAVQHAHTALVVHRDLKPANILVDATGAVRLLDFGIARLLGGDGDAGDAETMGVGARPLTPAYAAPEQRAGEPGGVAADVYSLGVVAYELIAGVLPHEENGAAHPRGHGDRPPPALTRALARDDGSPRDPAGHHGVRDTRPDMRASNGEVEGHAGREHTVPQGAAARLAARGTGWRRYRMTVRGDLTAIVHTALAVEPERRYPTVAAFAEDLQRWLDGAPVRVSGNGLVYRVRKFVRRNALPVALAAVCVAVLLAGIGGIVWQSRQTALAAERATTVKDFLAALLTSANPFVRPGATPTVRALLDEAGRRVEGGFRDRPALAAELLGVIGTSYRGLGEMQLADRYLSQAIAMAARAHIDVDVLGDIQAEYVNVLIGRNEHAQAMASAQAALAQLPAGAGVVRARLLIGLATAQLLSGDAQAALQSGEEAARLACADDSVDPPACVQALIELKYFRQFADDLPGSLAVAKDAWARAERLHAGTDNPQRVQAAGAYGDALSVNGRTTEAIAVLGSTVELARRIYGEHNFRYARALDWYAAALDDAWRLPEALAATEQALAIAHAAMPRSPLSATLLQRSVRLQLDLQRTADAANTLARRDELLPDPVPDHHVDDIALGDLRLRLLGHGATSALAAEAAALADRLVREDRAASHQADLLAARIALGTGDAALAQRLLERAASAPTDSVVAGAQRAVVQAQLHGLAGDHDAALHTVSAARRSLRSLAPEPGPLVFEAMRIEADLHCRAGHADEGVRVHAAAMAYWQQRVDASAMPAEVRQLPAGCGVPSAAVVQ